MNYKELDKMWHDIRERNATESEGLSDEELVKRANESVLEYMKELGLKFASPTSKIHS